MQAEAVRQFYLGAAGITMWYAREPLPGAAPSPAYDFGTAEPASVAHQKAMAEIAPSRKSDLETATRGRDKIAHLQSLMSAVEKPTQKTRVKPAPEPETVPEPARDIAAEAIVKVEQELSGEHAEAPADTVFDVPRLRLQAWAGSGVVLIASISEESSLSLQESLAINILRSLNERSPIVLGAVHWPLFNNLKVSLNRSDHLVDVLRSCFRDVADKHVIVLGEGGPWLESALSKQPNVVFPGTLAKLAADPSLKRELWQMLRSMAE
ncbi:hypothetical protein [Marinobacter sp. SS5-14b]|uniref:hypothetical protein n=1 Tax=Marinobacter sp. SS5-14b TaxID=3050456 RepID=UPI0026DFFF8E|nr:hypothetical protein [Marinobacter sp. SS5-14b]